MPSAAIVVNIIIIIIIIRTSRYKLRFRSFGRNNATRGFVTGCLEKNCVFPRIFSILRLLPRLHWAVIGCTKYGQPIGVTVHSHYFESLLHRYVDEGWVAVDWEKHNFY